ncbi:MAG: translational GTPase TypA [Candidatus Melainabacteria bacterium]|nr:translational GTPase TypA [Candidatus Melainabacteria bacterium]
MNKNIRNIAIIAHVDHGKTTLVDSILKYTGVFRSNQVVESCVMDSNELEQERGITILAKNTAVKYGDYLINIVDTPGHADFGGEVERVLGMVDGCLLIVDAFEGAKPQTRFVLRKALEKGLRPILVLNKIDRTNISPDKTIDQVIDLLIELGADDSQIDFPILYCSGLHGIAKYKLEDEVKDIKPLLDTIVHYVPPPLGDETKPFQFHVTSIDYDNYLGRVLIGRVHNGKVKANEPVSLITLDGSIKREKVYKLFSFENLKKVEINEASSGMIIAISGLPNATIGETVACIENPEALPPIKIDEPTLQMVFSVNDSPFAGKEGKYVTSRQIRERLYKELESNVALRVQELEGSGDKFLVSGRGELHLGILIETMRREGYEFQVGKPQVIMKTINNKQYEPFENLVLDVKDEYVGVCIEAMGKRKGELKNMHSDSGMTVLEFEVPTRGLIGYRGTFIKQTKGEGVMNHSFFEYKEYAGDINNVRGGVIIAFESGVSTAYAILNALDRGEFFIKPGVDVYQGMIVGENSKPQDLEVNVCKTKKLTNMRSAGAEVLETLPPPREMFLEEALEYINKDELIEVTPKSIRLRKAILDPSKRKSAGKSVV